VKNSWASVGTYKKKILKNELLYKKYRRSIYSIKDIKKGDFFSKNNIAIIRPGFGGDPRKFNKLLDSKSKKNYKFGARIKT
jgi:N-acetylneuraminate synthase